MQDTTDTAGGNTGGYEATKPSSDEETERKAGSRVSQRLKHPVAAVALSVLVRQRWLFASLPVAIATTVSVRVLGVTLLDWG